MREIYSPDSKKEEEDTIGCIITFLNLLEINENNIVLTAYSQIESLLKKKAHDRELINIKGRYTFNKYLEKILESSEYELKSYEEDIIEIIRKDFRKLRNYKTHNLHRIIVFEDVQEMIMNLMKNNYTIFDYLYSCYYEYITMSNFIIKMFEQFCEIYKKYKGHYILKVNYKHLYDYRDKTCQDKCLIKIE